jgi:hypothetical protein
LQAVVALFDPERLPARKISIAAPSAAMPVARSHSGSR